MCQEPGMKTYYGILSTSAPQSNTVKFVLHALQGLSIGLLVCGWAGVLPVSDTQILEFSF